MTSRSLTFGVSAAHGGATLVEGAKNVAAALGARIGRIVRPTVLDSYQTLEAAVVAGTVHVAWLPPLLHARATASGARLVAVPERGGAVVYRSALLVRADAPIRAVTDLAGKKAAWSDPSSSAGAIFPRRHLAAAGVTLASETMAGSFRAACAAVADGDADVCGCFVSEVAAKTGPPAILADIAKVFAAAPWRLRVLAVTDAIPPDGIVVAARVEQEMASAIAGALLSLHHERVGADALEKMLSARKLVAPDAHVKALVAGLVA